MLFFEMGIAMQPRPGLDSWPSSLKRVGTGPPHPAVRRGIVMHLLAFCTSLSGLLRFTGQFAGFSWFIELLLLSESIFSLLLVLQYVFPILIGLTWLFFSFLASGLCAGL